jgi:hypothetical protein
MLASRGACEGRHRRRVSRVRIGRLPRAGGASRRLFSPGARARARSEPSWPERERDGFRAPSFRRPGYRISPALRAGLRARSGSGNARRRSAGRSGRSEPANRARASSSLRSRLEPRARGAPPRRAAALGDSGTHLEDLSGIRASRRRARGPHDPRVGSLGECGAGGSCGLGEPRGGSRGHGPSRPCLAAACEELPKKPSSNATARRFRKCRGPLGLRFGREE